MGIKKKAKKLNAANEELTKRLSAVRAQLTRTETKLGKANEKAKRWQGEAAAARAAASRSNARVEKRRKNLARASPPEAGSRRRSTGGGRHRSPGRGAHRRRRSHQPRPDVDSGPTPSRGPRPWTGRHVEQAQGAAALRVGPRRLIEPSPITVRFLC